LDAQICIEGVFSCLYLNVCIRFARKSVKNESEHFVGCERKNLLAADCKGAKRVNSFAGRSHMLMYDKTCGEDG